MPSARKMPLLLFTELPKGFIPGNRFRHKVFSEPKRHKQKPSAISTPRASKSIRLFLPHPTLPTTSTEPPYSVVRSPPKRPPRACSRSRYLCAPLCSKGCFPSSRSLRLSHILYPPLQQVKQRTEQKACGYSPSCPEGLFSATSPFVCSRHC